MNKMRLVVVGASGRMGRMLTALILNSKDCRLAGAIECVGSSAVGEDAGLLAGHDKCGIIVTDDAHSVFASADGIIDFTTPEASVAYSQLAAQAGIVHVVGTTGMEDRHFSVLKESATRSVIVQSGNMSLGINILATLVRKLATALNMDWDIEIVEMHHRMKVDAPSGAALLLGEAAAAGRNISLVDNSVTARNGYTGLRPSGSIGFATLRGGSVVGDHKVIFAGEGERIELAHIAEQRQLFAQGAIKAALWGFNRAPGLYSMADVLELDRL